MTGLYPLADIIDIDKDQVGNVVTAFPVLEDELAVIRAKEQLLMEAGWASAEALGEASLDLPVVQPAQPLPDSTRVKCKNCKAWFCSADRGQEDMAVAVAEPVPSAPVSGTNQLLSPRTMKEFRCKFHPGCCNSVSDAHSMNYVLGVPRKPYMWVHVRAQPLNKLTCTRASRALQAGGGDSFIRDH